MAARPSEPSITRKDVSFGSRGRWQDQPYRYEPLENAESIRLLKLLPAVSSTAPILGELITVRLGDCQPYEAVSYRCGEPSSKLSLREGSLKVSLNLASALRRFPPEGGTKVSMG
jgi:hypothetical protein